jgi:hypothetical protein
MMLAGFGADERVTFEGGITSISYRLRGLGARRAGPAIDGAQYGRSKRS